MLLNELHASYKHEPSPCSRSGHPVSQVRKMRLSRGERLLKVRVWAGGARNRSRCKVTVFQESLQLADVRSEWGHRKRGMYEGMNEGVFSRFLHRQMVAGGKVQQN